MISWGKYNKNSYSYKSQSETISNQLATYMISAQSSFWNTFLEGNILAKLVNLSELPRYLPFWKHSLKDSHATKFELQNQNQLHA